MSGYAEIKNQLKQLKLSGASSTLELRLMEAESNDLSFSEVLSMLLSDEIELRRNRSLQRLISHAHLESNKTLEHFDFTFNPTIKPQLIRELSTCNFMDKAENIFFIGPTGTGKTFLSKAIAHAACRKHLRVEFYSFRELFSSLQKADLANRLDRALNVIIKSDLLIIDDFGFKKLEQKSAEYLYAIIESRYRLKSTIITSNRSITDWSSIFPDPVMANAVMDRLCHNAHQIVIKGESYRKKFKPEIKNARE
jgi:DNA replication protein DnaC